MQDYTIKARVQFKTKADTINKAIFKLYQLILPQEACSYDEKKDSMLISLDYINAIVIEEIIT